MVIAVLLFSHNAYDVISNRDAGGIALVIGLSVFVAMFLVIGLIGKINHWWD